MQFKKSWLQDAFCHCLLYTSELTMANGYLLHEYSDKTVYFDMFFRRVPDGGGYAIFAGLEQVIEYLKNLEFTDEDIDYLRRKNIFSDKFLEYLKDFKFECDVWSVPELSLIHIYLDLEVIF